jgi:hypothetical protein
MLLSEKVKEILIEAGDTNRADSQQSCKFIADKFYCQYEANPRNYTPLKEFVLNIIK